MVIDRNCERCKTKSCVFRKRLIKARVEYRAHLFYNPEIDYWIKENLKKNGY